MQAGTRRRRPLLGNTLSLDFTQAYENSSMEHSPSDSISSSTNSMSLSKKSSLLIQKKPVVKQKSKRSLTTTFKSLSKIIDLSSNSKITKQQSSKRAGNVEIQINDGNDVIRKQFTQRNIEVEPEGLEQMAKQKLQEFEEIWKKQARYNSNKTK